MSNVVRLASSSSCADCDTLKSFTFAFYISAVRSMHALSRVCAEQTVMDGSAYGRVLLDAKVLFELGRVVWQSKTSPMDEKGHVPESLKCRPQGSSRVKGKVKTCVMTVLRTLTSTKFKLALTRN